MPASDHEKRHRPVLQPELARDERRQSGEAHEQRHPVRVAQMRDEVRRALPEIAVRAFEPEELWQLRARQIERQPRFEAHEHGFGEEADGIAGADQPRRKRDHCDQQRHACRKRRMACRITGAEIAHGRADQQRQRRGDGNDRVLRAAEDPEDEPRKQAGVQTRLRRESRKRRVSDSRGQQVRGKREAGHEIRPQPLGPILGHPPQGSQGDWRRTRVHISLRTAIYRNSPKRGASATSLHSRVGHALDRRLTRARRDTG